MSKLITVPKQLTVKEVADTLRISARTVTRMIDDQRLKACRIGNRVRVDPRDLQAFILNAQQF